MMAFLSDLVLSIFSILPELLRQLPLSGKIAGGNTYPPVRAVSKRIGREKSMGTHTSKHNRSNCCYVSIFTSAEFEQEPNQISYLINNYFLEITTLQTYCFLQQQ